MKKTVENVRNYLERLLYVKRLNTPFELLMNSSNFKYSDGHETIAKDCDVYLSVFLRTYGTSSTLAAATYASYEGETYRPLQGVIYINDRKIPDEVENENSSNSKFFYIVLHETFHALGILSNAFNHYHPQNDTTPYENPIVNITDEETGKIHKFLVTPNAHKFAVMQYGVEEFTINGKSVPSGIELEDGGDIGTVGTHPEARVCNQDVMVGVIIQSEYRPYMRVTPVTAAFLLDTGNYEINWRMVQPLVWGNKEAIDGKPKSDFVMSPPAKSFPQQYIYRPSTDIYDDKCGFSFKMTGSLNKLELATSYYNCSLPFSQEDPSTKAYCDAEKFYNADNETEIGGIWPYDFQIIHLPSIEVCSKGNACIAGMTYCGKFKISHDKKSFTIQVRNGFEITCDSSNEGKTIYGNWYLYKCPPIEQFVRTVEMMENQEYFTYNPLDNTSIIDYDKEDNYSNSSGLSQTIIIIIVIAAVLIILCIVAIVTCYISKKTCWKLRRNNASNSITTPIL